MDKNLSETSCNLSAFVSDSYRTSWQNMKPQRHKELEEAQRIITKFNTTRSETFEAKKSYSKNFNKTTHRI